MPDGFGKGLKYRTLEVPGTDPDSLFEVDLNVEHVVTLPLGDSKALFLSWVLCIK